MFFSKESKSLTTNNGAERAVQVSKLVVKQQTETPLAISPLKVDSSDPQVYEASYKITNISNKTIRAYTIAHSMIVGDQTSKGALSTDLDLTNKELKPNESEIDSEVYEVPTLGDITLSVDFIEFADGTTWGDNVFTTADLLAGQRYSAHELSTRLTNVLNKEGYNRLLNILVSDEVNYPPPEEHSARWNEGFDSGKKITMARLKRAIEKGGEEQLRRELLESNINKKVK